MGLFATAVVAVVAGSCGGEPEGEVEVGKVILKDSQQVASQRLAPLPEARTEVVGAAWEGKVAVIGGLTESDGGTAVARVDLYHPANDSWSSGPPLPVPLHHAGAAVLAGRLYVAGGFTNLPGAAWTPQSAVWSLGVGEAQWRPEAPLATPRGALALAALGTRLFALGGADGKQVLRSVEILELGSTWKPGPDLASEREHLAATVARGRVFAIGGRVGSLESNRDQVESLAPGDKAWRQERPLGYNRGGIGAASPMDRACVAGGEAIANADQGDTIKPVECLD
ncbi:MAG: Kelch repeat-containing protein, partial [Acidimicrobiia bacterium]